MAKRKVFEYGDLVRVKVPGKRAFLGTVYSQYKDPGRERRICINTPSGAGVAFLVRYVTRAQKQKPRQGR